MAQRRSSNSDKTLPEEIFGGAEQVEVGEGEEFNAIDDSVESKKESKQVKTRNQRKPSREAETREASSRPKQWSPASLLPEPEPREGVKYRWVRKTIFGNDDPTNFSRKVREGWEPCRIEDHPELRLHVDRDAVDSGLVEVGGLILCQMPVEMVEQRNQYYGRKTDAQMESVDNNLMKENDPRMPLFNNRQSSVSFGRGGSS